MIEISIPHDFSTLPGGRVRHAGPDSGEEFRQDHLEPQFQRARGSNQKLCVQLDGTELGYPIGFLEEAFGGLARQFGRDAVLETLDLICSDDNETMRLSVLSKDGAYARYEAGTIRWTECDAIERDPDRMRGAWRFKGTEVPLANLFHALAAGSNAAEFVQDNDGVEETAPATVLEFLAEQLDDAKEALWQYGGPRTATPPLLDGGKHNRDADRDPDTTHWKDCSAASRDAERMSGAWCIGHLRFPLSILFTNLASMGSVREFLDAFSVTIDETLPVLQFLADNLDTVRPALSDTLTEVPARPGGQN